MLPRRKCPFCRRWFHPHPRLKRRQQTCGRSECRRQQKRKSNRQWRAKDPDYFRGAYPGKRKGTERALTTCASITTISQWLGHASVATANPYATVDLERKRKAIEQARPTDFGPAGPAP
jgi:hypothetical protein